MQEYETWGKYLKTDFSVLAFLECQKDGLFCAHVYVSWDNDYNMSHFSENRRASQIYIFFL